MRTDTNMAWPDDPYGTGQLWRKEPRLLAGFAISFLPRAQREWPVSYAVAYLRLRRTQAIDLTSGVSFGFRAVTIESDADLGMFLEVFDLDAMRARRLAKVVAGWRLAEDLALLSAHSGRAVHRGIQSLAESWRDQPHRNPALGEMCDVACGGTVATDLATVAASNGIDISPVGGACQSLDFPNTSSAARSTSRALIYALIAGRILDRFTWDSPLDVEAIIAANAGDCFSAQDLRPAAELT